MSGGETLFRERLTPRPYAFLIVEALIAMISVAYGAPFGARLGWLVFAGLSVIAIWAMIRTSPVIEVTTTHLRAGPATIERRYLGTVEALDAPEFRQARGRDADARRFSLLRSWHSGSGVVIALTDPQDPHPGWIVTTARPGDLAAALA